MVAAYLETAVLPVAERTASVADHAANKQVYWSPFDKSRFISNYLLPNKMNNRN